MEALHAKSMSDIAAMLSLRSPRSFHHESLRHKRVRRPGRTGEYGSGEVGKMQGNGGWQGARGGAGHVYGDNVLVHGPQALLMSQPNMRVNQQVPPVRVPENATPSQPVHMHSEVGLSRPPAPPRASTHQPSCALTFAHPARALALTRFSLGVKMHAGGS